MISTKIIKNLLPYPVNVTTRTYAIEDFHIKDYPYYDGYDMVWSGPCENGNISIPNGVSYWNTTVKCTPYLRDPIPFYPKYWPASTVTSLRSAVSISYIELIDSISSSVAPSLIEKWVLEFHLAKGKTLFRKPTVPTLVRLRPFRGRKPIMPVLKIIVASDIRRPRNGEPWKPNKLQRILYLRNLRQKTLYDLKFKKYVKALKAYNALKLAYQKKAKSIALVNEKRLKNYDKRLLSWNKALIISERRFIKAKRRNHRVVQNNPYRRLRLYNSLSYGTGYTYVYDSHWSYMLSGGGPTGDSRYFYSPGTTSKWEHVWKSHLIPEDIDTPQKEQLLAEGTYSVFTRLASETINDLSDKGIRKLFSKFSNQKINVGNLLAERQQTLELFRSTLTKLSALATGKKQLLKNVALFIKNPKLWANEILAFKFGVEPLVSDFNTAVKYLSKDDNFVTVSARTLDRRPVSISNSEGASFSGIISVRYQIKANIDNVMFTKLNEWGITNPLPIAWELTPWSFVIDWLIPVGAYISSLTAFTGLTFVSGTKHVKLRGVFTQVGSSVNIGNPTCFSTRCINGEWSGEIEYREVLTDFPANFPLSIKNPLSATHGLEAVCLLIQKIHRFR